MRRHTENRPRVRARFDTSTKPHAPKRRPMPLPKKEDIEEQLEWYYEEENSENGIVV